MVISEEIVQAKQGTVLMKQGAYGDSAYLLLQGKLIVEKTKENGEMMIVAQLTPINLVGELALFDEINHSATVTVSEDARLIVLKKHRLRTMIHKSPEITEIIIKLLCNKLRTLLPS